jgi:hypothetical protein
MDSIGQDHCVEVQNQADPQAGVMEITEHLGSVNAGELIYRLHFDDHAILYD